MTSKKQRTAIWVGFLFAAVGYAIFGLSGWLGSLLLGCIALLIAHSGGGTIWTLSNLLLQTTTPDRFRGRVFAVNSGLGTLTTGLSTLLYGLALQASDSPMILALVGALLFGLYGIVWGIGATYGPLRITEATVASAREVKSSAPPVPAREVD